MRKLTKYFHSYVIQQYQKHNKVSLMKMIDFDDMNIDTLFTMIKLGNAKKAQNKWIYIDDEQAGDMLDNYIAENDENSYITAYIELLDELDTDMHLFKSFGINVNKIKQDMKAKVAEIAKVETDDEVDADLGDIEVEV